MSTHMRGEVEGVCCCTCCTLELAMSTHIRGEIEEVCGCPWCSAVFNLYEAGLVARTWDDSVGAYRYRPVENPPEEAVREILGPDFTLDLPS